MSVPERKWCPRCERELPARDYSKRRTRHGKPALDSYCRECRRQLARQRFQDPEARKHDLEVIRARYHRARQDPEWVEQERERKREVRRRWREQDPERAREDQRFHYRKQRERDTGTLERQHAPKPQHQYYRAPSKVEVVPAAPLREFMLDVFAGWDPHEIQALLGGAVSARGLSRVLRDLQPVVELDFADRLLTRGLGRPDLLNALYPLEEPA